MHVEVGCLPFPAGVSRRALSERLTSESIRLHDNVKHHRVAASDVNFIIGPVGKSGAWFCSPACHIMKKPFSSAVTSIIRITSLESSGTSNRCFVVTFTRTICLSSSIKQIIGRASGTGKLNEAI